MKYSIFLTCSLLASIVISCSHAPAKEIPNENPATVLKDFQSWWNYNYRNIKLYENYTPLDTLSNPISKNVFLKSLAAGNCVAFRLKTADQSLKYKLYKLSAPVDKSIIEVARQFGKDQLVNYTMEGTAIPDFNFTDLDGKVYNRETTKGKIIVLKCWFVRCTTCVAEMPALNEVVKQYKDRDDIVFISLAFDSREKLRNFLTKTKFNYPVVSIDEEYIEKKLKVSAYPTHFVINRKGLISSVTTDYHDMLSSLKNQLAMN